MALLRFKADGVVARGCAALPVGAICFLPARYWLFAIRFAPPRRSRDMVYGCGSGHGIHFGYILLVVCIGFYRFFGRVSARKKLALEGSIWPSSSRLNHTLIPSLVLCSPTFQPAKLALRK
ncbi:MAG: hypothetical protein QOG67_1658 [Verrucomicrobiota bacterium]